MYHILFIHSSVSGNSVRFHVNSAVVNWGACMFLNYGVFQIYVQEWDGAIKLLEKNIGRTLFDLNCNSIF